MIFTIPQPETTDADKHLAMRRITRATIELSSSRQFALISGLLAYLHHTVTDTIETAGVLGRKVYWSAAWIANLDTQRPMKPKNINYVLAHEAGHNLFRHNQTAIRMKQQDPERAAIAIDQVVNNWIEDVDPDHAVVEMPQYLNPLTGKLEQYGYMDRKYQGMSAWAVFQQLPPGKGNGAGGFDSHEFELEEATENDLKELEVAIATGKRRAERLGAKDIVSEESRTRDYLSLLARWMYGQGRKLANATWRTPNRRMINHGVYLPGRSGKSLRRAVYAIDTSGSIGGPELKQSIDSVTALVKQLGCEELHLIYWDHGVASHEVYRFATGQKLAATQPKGGGGTCFEPVLQFIDSEGINPDVMIVNTDGYIAGWGEKPSYPTIWMITTEVEPPWGDLIKV